MERTDPGMDELAEAWIRYQRRHRRTDRLPDEDPDDWALERLHDWFLLEEDTIEPFWEAILAICAGVQWGKDDDDDSWVVVMIGAGPLEDFITKFEVRAMDLIEPQLDANDTLLKALAGAWTQTTTVGARVEQALADRGQERY